MKQPWVYMCSPSPHMHILFFFSLFSSIGLFVYLCANTTMLLLLLFSHEVVSNSLRPHGLQHVRLPFTISQSLLKLMSIESVIPSYHLILHHPLLLPSIFPRIRVFSSELALHIRCPKYWSFSFSISPSNEYSGLVSFRIDWFDLHTVQVTFESLLQHHNSKASVLRNLAFFNGPTLTSIYDYWKNHSFDFSLLSAK